MTKVINIFGGSGVGKSTLAAGLFYFLKMKNKEVELVTEYVKRWAWQGKRVGPYDQIYIFGKQARSEYELYGKVDYIITDSPLILSAVYEKFYNGDSLVESAVFKHMDKAQSNGVEFHNFTLKRNKEFNPKGRFETKTTALQVDNYIREYLDLHNVDYTNLDCEDKDRVSMIMESIL